MDTLSTSTRAAHFVEDACAARRINLLWAIDYAKRSLECLKLSGLDASEIERVKSAFYDACSGSAGHITNDMADKAGKYADVLGPIDLSGLEG